MREIYRKSNMMVGCMREALLFQFLGRGARVRVDRVSSRVESRTGTCDFRCLSSLPEGVIGRKCPRYEIMTRLGKKQKTGKVG